MTSRFQLDVTMTPFHGQLLVVAPTSKCEGLDAAWLARDAGEVVAAGESCVGLGVRDVGAEVRVRVTVLDRTGAPSEESVGIATVQSETRGLLLATVYDRPGAGHAIPIPAEEMTLSWEFTGSSYELVLWPTPSREPDRPCSRWRPAATKG